MFAIVWRRASIRTRAAREKAAVRGPLVVLIADTGPLIALADRADGYHEAIKAYAAGRRDTWILPAPVVTESAITILDRLGADEELGFLRAIAAKELHVEPTTDADLQRTIEILDQYRDARFGMVDAATMAIAERLKIEVILTLDKRDFGIFRPKHCAAFRLVPEGLR
jgi:predicted nucleic acid-binding protein